MSSYYEKFLATGEVKCIDEEIPFEVPKGWEWCRFSSLYFSLTDGTHSTPKYQDNGIPFMSVKDMSSGKLNFDSTKYISQEEHNILIKRCNPQKGDLLLSKVGTTGIPLIIDTEKEFSIFVSLALAKFSHEFVNPEYLIILIQSPLVQIQASENTRGVGNKNWVLSAISNTLMVLPPYKEQCRIVEKIRTIEPCLEKYTNSFIKLESLSNAINETLKKSILQEAIQGKLVPQDPSEEPASILLQRIRDEKQRLVKEGKLKKKDVIDSTIFRGDDNKYYEQVGKQCKDITEEIPFDLPDSWTWVRLGSISDIIGGYAFQSSSLKEEQGKRVIRISDISEQGFVNTNIVRYNGAPITDIYRIQKYDIIIAMTGGTVGKSLFVRELPEDELLLNQRVARIRNLWMNVNYLYFVIIAPHIKEFINKQKNSTNDNISMSDISNFLIPLPSIKEQQRIVAQIERLFEQLK